MGTELQIAILGFVATLSGTVLAWLLNRLSQKGKIRLFVKKWEESYRKPDGYGGFKECEREEAEYYHYNLSLDIYNSSCETRIMRDIHVLYMDKSKKLFLSNPKGNATRGSSHSLVQCDEISVVNIQAKSVAASDLRGGLNNGKEEWRFLSCADRVMLMYIDEKNRREKVLVCKDRLKSSYSSK